MQTHKLSVIVGRFQVHMLHAGHVHLINHAKARGDALLILIGSGQGFGTARKPLPFPIRKAMVEAEYPEAIILELYDMPSDDSWSRALDKLIETVFPRYTVTLFGSRDSFLPHYKGKFTTVEVPPTDAPSGAEVRESLKTDTPVSTDFRRGIIHAHVTRAPIPYPVVDVAIVNKVKREVLLGEKSHDAGMRRFLGGFFDPTKDPSLERAAKREAYEETSGIEIDELTYLGSRQIDDWRYRGDVDCLITAFFRAEYIFGAPRPSDDIDALHWTPYEDVLSHLMPEHRPLGELLIKSLNN